jgi:hypothetical protein
VEVFDPIENDGLIMFSFFSSFFPSFFFPGLLQLEIIDQIEDKLLIICFSFLFLQGCCSWR